MVQTFKSWTMGEAVTLEQLISFGEYLLSKERTEKIINHPDAAQLPPVEERLASVHHSDIENWKEKRFNELPTG